MKLHNAHVLEFKRVIIKTYKMGIGAKRLSKSMGIPFLLANRIKTSSDKINSTVINPYMYRCSTSDYSTSIVFVNLAELQRTEVDASIIVSMRKGITVKHDGLVFERIYRNEVEDEDLIV